VSDLQKAQDATALTLKHVLETSELTYLTLPERETLAEDIARLLPAGNVPSMVAAGLLRSGDPAVSPAEHRRNLTLLMQGVNKFMDRAVYQTFYAGPAALLSAYQMLLKLTGKEENSFPDGTWQFYVEFGLREDTGRHACETNGFQAILREKQLALDSTDQLSAWIAAASWLLANDEDLLATEWLERAQLRHFAEHTGVDLLPDWIKRRPYHIPDDPDVQAEFTHYLEYRAKFFHIYYQSNLDQVDPPTRAELVREWELPAVVQARYADLAAYQRQLSIRTRLDPNEFSDQRQPISSEALAIGVIWQDHYYLVQGLTRHGTPLSPRHVRPLAAAILSNQPNIPAATLDDLLTATQRHIQPQLRRMIPAESQPDFEALRSAPILINWDELDSQQPLSLIRRGKRGVGDHPLTMLRTEQSMVFDLSHIFFDGPWGLAVAEILTGQATRLALELNDQPPLALERGLPAVRPLHLQSSPQMVYAGRSAMLPTEVSAETTSILLPPIQKLRTLFTKRNETLKLTVNDILVLYRSMFGRSYQAAPGLMIELSQLLTHPNPVVRKAAQSTQESLDTIRGTNPSILIPMDATLINPRERIYPTTFRNPFPDFYYNHHNVIELFHAFQSAQPAHKNLAWGQFDTERKAYLTAFRTFGELMMSYKAMTMQGESISTSTLRLLGNLPNSVRRVLNEIPDRVEVINDVVKGQEVFSNVGQVSAGSSIQRFITAKDDNDKKTLAWGFMTDAVGVVHLSLRDFRPHVALLMDLGLADFAQRLTQDYLDSYAEGLNRYVEQMNWLLQVRRPTMQ
jgi:hypothetical protein